MRRFRFRLARLLALRERVAERRRDELALARDAVHATLAALGRERAARAAASGALEEVEAPGAERRRHDLVLHCDLLDARIAALHADLAARRLAEERAAEALRVALRERKILARLRERRRLEHLRHEARSEQAALDDLAQRAARAAELGIAFRERKELPGDGLQ